MWAVNANGKRALHISRWTEADVARRVAAMRGMLDVGRSFAQARSGRSRAVPRDVQRAVAAGSRLAGWRRRAQHLGRRRSRRPSPGDAGDGALHGRQERRMAGARFRHRPDARRRRVRDTSPQQSREHAGRRRCSDSAIRSSGPAPRPWRRAPDGARNLVVAANAQQAATYTVENGFRYASIPLASRNSRGAQCARLRIGRGSEPRPRARRGGDAQSRPHHPARRPPRRRLRHPWTASGRHPRPVETRAGDGGRRQSRRLAAAHARRRACRSSSIRNGSCCPPATPRVASATASRCRVSCAASSSPARAPCSRRTGRWSRSRRAQLVSRTFAEYARDTDGNRASSLRRAQLAMIDGSLGDGKYVASVLLGALRAVRRSRALSLRAIHSRLMRRVSGPWSHLLGLVDPRHVYIGLAVALAVWTAMSTLFDRQHHLKTSTYDWMLNHRLREPVPDPDIVLIDIDERSLAAMASEYGRWPWPRDVLATMLAELEAQGAKAVVFDILFSDADRQNPVSERAFDEAVAASRIAYFPVLRLNPANDAKSAVHAVDLKGLVVALPQLRRERPQTRPPRWRSCFRISTAPCAAAGSARTTSTPTPTPSSAATACGKTSAAIACSRFPRVWRSISAGPMPDAAAKKLRFNARPMAYRTLSFSDVFMDLMRKDHTLPPDDIPRQDRHHRRHGARPVRPQGHADLAHRSRHRHPRHGHRQREERQLLSRVARCRWR